MTKRLTIALIALLAFAMIAMLPVAAANAVNLGNTVFRGEAGLDITAAMPIGAENMLYWWAPGTSIANGDAFSASVPVTNKGGFFVDPSMQTGAWYNRSGTTAAGNATLLVADPHLAISIWDTTASPVDRTDGSVIRIDGIQQSRLQFRIVSNLDVMSLATERNWRANVTIRVGTPDGNVFTGLRNQTGFEYALTPAGGLTGINANPFWVRGNGTNEVWDVSQPHYPRGTYTFWATCNENSMNDNYNVVGKTKSTTHSIELIDEDTIITSNKDTVVRNNDFAVTITGRPNSQYALWVKGTSALGNETIPQIKVGQQGVAISAGARLGVGNTQWRTGDFIRDDVPGGGTAAVPTPLLIEGTSVLANVTLNDAGTRTVAFMTNQNTTDRTFTIRTQRIGSFDDFDEVKVKVEQGAVTITASGDRSYYLGQEVTLSGTNSDSSTTFLFITGPNLPTMGGQLDAPSAPITPAGAATGINIQRTVRSDDTWEYKWRTGESMIDPGTYTIYAVSQERDRNNLANVKYSTVSVVIRKGFITATPSATTVAKGDKLFIRGVAEGEPDNVQIWLFGVNRYQMDMQTVEDDGTFEYELTGGTTAGLSAGQYFVVAQHPMANGRFDVEETAFNVGAANEQRYVNIRGNAPPAAGAAPTANFFIALGAGRLQGSDAAEALTRLLDFQQIDDTYTKLTFLVEEPWIRLDTISDKYVGTQFTITGTTNLAVDNELIMEVTSSAFRPTDKTASGEFAGQSAVVKVVRGDAGYNTFSMDVDASGFVPDEYIVKVESIEADATTTSTFNVLEGVPVTPAPATPVPATPVPATPVPTQPPATPASPGFGALVAIAGLGAVAFLVLRRD